MEPKHVFIVIIMLIAILAIISSLLILLNSALKNNKLLSAQLQILSIKNRQNETIIKYLRILGGDTNSMDIEVDIINQLPIDVIKNYWINLFMYNYHRMREYNGRFIGQYISGYFTEIKDEEKRNYFYSICDSALLQQPIERLINIFVTDLKEEIIVEKCEYESLVGPRTIFRNWFLKSITKQENFEKIGKNILHAITDFYPNLYKTPLTQEQVDQLYFWSSKINKLITEAEKNSKK